MKVSPTSSIPIFTNYRDLLSNHFWIDNTIPTNIEPTLDWVTFMKGNLNTFIAIITDSICKNIYFFEDFVIPNIL